MERVALAQSRAQGNEVCFTPGKQEIIPLGLEGSGLQHSLPQSCPTRSEPSTSGNPKVINTGKSSRIIKSNLRPSHHKPTSLSTISMCFLNPSRVSDSSTSPGLGHFSEGASEHVLTTLEHHNSKSIWEWREVFLPATILPGRQFRIWMVAERPPLEPQALRCSLSCGSETMNNTPLTSTLSPSM